MKKVWYIFLVILSVLYLFNPTAGVFELIPDNVPVIGNLDEVGATVLLINSLSALGWIKGKKKKEKNEN